MLIFFKAATKLNAQGDKKGKERNKTMVCSANRKQQHTSQGAKKVSFTACHSGKLAVASTS